MPNSSIFKDDIFEGKKVFVTGGATGMGLGFTKSFVEHGADVLIASRKEDKLRLAFEEIKKETGKEISWKVMDVRDNEAVENVAGFISKEWGELDILVNNAAGNFIAPVSSSKRSARVLLPWSICAIMQKFRILLIKIKDKYNSINPFF